MGPSATATPAVTKQQTVKATPLQPAAADIAAAVFSPEDDYAAFEPPSMEDIGGASQPGEVFQAPMRKITVVPENIKPTFYKYGEDDTAFSTVGDNDSVRGQSDDSDEESKIMEDGDLAALKAKYKSPARKGKGANRRRRFTSPARRSFTVSTASYDPRVHARPAVFYG